MNILDHKMDDFFINRIKIAEIMGGIKNDMKFNVSFIIYNTKTKNIECYNRCYEVISSLKTNMEQMYNNGDFLLFDDNEEFLCFFRQVCENAKGIENDWDNLIEHIEYVYKDKNLSKNTLEKCIERLEELKQMIIKNDIELIKKEWGLFDTRGIIKIYPVKKSQQSQLTENNLKQINKLCFMIIDEINKINKTCLEKITDEVIEYKLVKI